MENRDEVSRSIVLSDWNHSSLHSSIKNCVLLSDCDDRCRNIPVDVGRLIATIKRDITNCISIASFRSMSEPTVYSVKKTAQLRVLLIHPSGRCWQYGLNMYVINRPLLVELMRTAIRRA
ncbi:MAG: hypothetical protein ACLTE2_11390 [Eubacteriales bacterium]